MNQWKPDSYDRQLSFVSEYGKDLIELLKPASGETILDLGCGTGDLANEIAGRGAIVTGIDSAETMVAKAAAKYPNIAFEVKNAEHFTMPAPYDAVFSNAALHWMKDAAGVISSVWNVLKPGGRFVAEFGGKGNINVLQTAIQSVLRTEFGIDGEQRCPWYFPSIGEYAPLLEQQGFEVKFAVHFDRPTRLADGEQGVAGWIANLCGDFLEGLPEHDQQVVVEQVSRIVKPILWQEDAYYARLQTDPNCVLQTREKGIPPSLNLQLLWPLGFLYKMRTASARMPSFFCKCLNSAPKLLGKLAQSTPAMADGLLLLQSELSHRLVVFGQEEQRIIAEPSASRGFRRNPALHLAFRFHKAARIRIVISQAAYETCRTKQRLLRIFAYRQLFKLRKQLFIVLLVRSMLSGIARRVDAGLSVQPVHA